MLLQRHGYRYFYIDTNNWDTDTEIRIQPFTGTFVPVKLPEMLDDTIESKIIGPKWQ